MLKQENTKIMLQLGNEVIITYIPVTDRTVSFANVKYGKINFENLRKLKIL
jgi:hypothetical protein